MASFKEKIGYGFGDMSSSMFWKIFSYYLPIFYSDIFGLSLGSTAVLMLVTRIWDTISDPIMGIIADRTSTRWGRYRPWLLWMAVPFAVAGCLLFITPGGSETVRLAWAYVTYILMMTVYTGINVPYGSMLAVVSDNSDEKTVFSSYRMIFAYAGSFIAVFAWEPLVSFFISCETFDNALEATRFGWQNAMFVIATITLILFLLCFRMTRENVTLPPSGSVWGDVKALLVNVPWWLLTGAALCTNLFNTLRGSVAAYYFKYYIGETARIDLGFTSFIFFAGVFLAVGEVCNMVGVALAVPVSRVMGKRLTFMVSAFALAVLSIAFFYVPANNSGFIIILILQVAISVLTGIISPLIWSMYADVADYSATKNGTSSTGLIFSSGSMAQKLGGALAGSAVLWLLAYFGLVPNATEQTDTAILGIRLIMSYIPAAVAISEIIILIAYPIGKKTYKMGTIN